MATIKAGTYKFNDTLTFFESFFTTGTINFYFGTTSCVGMVVFGGDEPYVVYNYDSGDGETVYNNGWVSTDYQTIAVLNDTEIIDTQFSDWFTDNAVLTETEVQSPVAYIKYENFTRAILFSGQTATLPCAGKLMRDDVIVEIESDISGGTGNIDLTEIDTLIGEGV